MSTVPAIHECEHNFFPSTGTNAQYLPLIDAVLGYTELILYLSEPELMLTVDQTKLVYKTFFQAYMD